MTVVVVDTNVWVSGIFFRGVPYLVLRAWRDRRFKMVYTPETLAEIEKTLTGKAIQFGVKIADVREWLEYIRTYAHIVAPTGACSGVCRDPADDKFLDAAVSGKADYIVSGDKDLLDLGRYQAIEIISPKEFLRLLDSGVIQPSD